MKVLLTLLLSCVTLTASPQNKLLDELKRQEDEAALKEVLPLTPAEIKQFRDMTSDVAFAGARPPYGEFPETITSSSRVSLKPGAKMVTLRIVPPYIATVAVLDKSGQPWPVEDFTGSRKENKLLQVSRTKAHALQISAMTSVGHGNVVLNLLQNPTPVIINVVVGPNDKHDSRRDLHLFEVCGPNCEQVTEYNPPMDSVVYDLLDGIPPQGAIPVAVNGSANTQVWKRDNLLYIRTREILISPACVGASARSLDGTRACIIKNIPKIRISRGGRSVDVRLGHSL